MRYKTKSKLIPLAAKPREATEIMFMLQGKALAFPASRAQVSNRFKLTTVMAAAPLVAV
jgi:hypothetical protein